MKFCARDGNKKNPKQHLPGTSMSILHGICFSDGLGPDFTD